MLFSPAVIKNLLPEEKERFEKIEKEISTSVSSNVSPLIEVIALLAMGPLSPLYPFFRFLGENIAFMYFGRTRCYLNALGKTNFRFVADFLKSPEYVSFFTDNLRSALNTRREEKIEQFAKLFASYSINFNNAQSEGAEQTLTDRYEEYLKMLDEMSFLEFLVLLDLHKRTKESKERGKQWLSSESWKSFLATTQEIMGLSNIEESEGFVLRLSRTGAFKFMAGFDGAFCGTTTPAFSLLLEVLE